MSHLRIGGVAESCVICYPAPRDQQFMTNKFLTINSSKKQKKYGTERSAMQMQINK